MKHRRVGKLGQCEGCLADHEGYEHNYDCHDYDRYWTAWSRDYDTAVGMILEDALKSRVKADNEMMGTKARNEQLLEQRNFISWILIFVSIGLICAIIG